MLISPKHGTQEEVPVNPNHLIGFFFSFGFGDLVNDELYKVRIASHIVRVSEDKFKN